MSDSEENASVLDVARDAIVRRLRRGGVSNTVVDTASAADNSSPFTTTLRDLARVKRNREMYEAGGPHTRLIDIRAVMTFGVGVDFAATDRRDPDADASMVEEWLHNNFPSRDNLMRNLAVDAYVGRTAFLEIVETRGGGFSHVQLVEPHTIDAEADHYGKVHRWIQTVTDPSGGRDQKIPIPKRYIVPFKLSGHPRQVHGLSLIEQNEREITQYAQNQESIQQALTRHGWPKYHVKVGRKGGPTVSDQVLRLVRNRFRNSDSKTNWITGADIAVDMVDTQGDFKIQQVTERDLGTLAFLFGVPLEIANIGGDGLGTGYPARVRLSAFEQYARSEQRQVGATFVDEVVRPVLDRYSPFDASRYDISLVWGDVINDQVTTAEWLRDFVDYFTPDEVRGLLDHPPHDGEDEELGPPEGANDDMGGLFPGFMAANGPQSPRDAEKGDGGGDTPFDHGGACGGACGPHAGRELAAYMEDNADDLTETERAFSQIYTHALWSDDTSRQLFTFDAENIPQEVKDVMAEVLDSGIIFSDFDAMSDSQRTAFLDVLRDSLDGPGASVDELIGELGEIAPQLEKYERERIARTELHEWVNQSRERYYTEEFETGAFRWIGPDDQNTTDICRELKAETRGGVSLDRLKELIVATARKYGADPREFTPHIMCRHTYIRVV